MIIEEIRNIRSGKVELRKFGIVLSIFLAILGGLFFLRGKECYFFFFGLSITFLSLGLFAPVSLKPIQKGWMSVAIAVNWFVTRVILIVLFYLVVVPTGLVARLFGNNFLDKGIDRTTDSYWVPRKNAGFEKGSCENQF